jgi:hypothetical protein
MQKEIDLLPCPLCGAGNSKGDTNVYYSRSVSGSINTGVSGPDDPDHTFMHCGMVRCKVCGILVISPNAVKLWNENRLRYADKTSA